VNSIALHSLKGGSGKTSTAIHLGAALSTPRRSVVLIDADPQRSAIEWYTWSQQQNRPLPFEVQHLFAGNRYVLERRFERLEADGVDLVIVDLPPELAESAEAAAGVVDLLLIPSTPSALDLRSAHAAIHLGREAREARGGRLPLISTVPSMLISRTRLAAEIAEALADYGEPVTPSIRRSVMVAQAGVDGGVVRPSSAVGQDYAKLARHVLARLRSV